MMSLFICTCGYVLENKETTSSNCEGCGRNYSFVNGVLVFLEEKDKFYEGVYVNQIKYLPRSEKIFHVLPLWLVNSGYLWAVRKYVEFGGTILELGCGSGVRYFGKKYEMCGCDLSFGSLEKLRGIYAWLIQADASEGIPIADNSVDAIVSSFFWEHVTVEQKERILSEARRILKPKGKLIFLYDVETMNPFIDECRRSNPNLYKELFIDSDQHFGYHTPLEHRKIFEAEGFKYLDHLGMEKTLFQSASTSEKLQRFDTKYKLLYSAMRLLHRKPLYYGYTLLLRIIDVTFGKLLPDSWSRIELTVLEKNSFENS